jgi:transcriptional regulator with XRE-family HTH domain
MEQIKSSSYKKYEALLQERNDTTYNVCKQTGINPSAISNWKNRDADYDLSYKNMVLLAKYFGVPAEYFAE